ncbi:hypothetical protein N9Y42_09210 [Mariniblastus sp.]|nr:hypothetical protein [Mariniblastus sp.]
MTSPISTSEQQPSPAENGSSANTPNPLLRESVDTSNLLKAKDSVRAAKIMIIDDEQLVIKVVKRYLLCQILQWLSIRFTKNNRI